MARPVQVFGALRAMIHDGKIGPQVALSEVVPGPHTYAVGALSELRGEVTILDDQVWLAYPEQHRNVRMVSESKTQEQATLLVTATVEDWRQIPIVQEIASADLDANLEALAGSAGQDTTIPFSVLVQGSFRNVRCHVLDGARQIRSDDDHPGARVERTLPDVQGVLVGFYSRHHEGVFTHRGSRSHFHVLLEDRSLTAHVDALTIEPGSTLLLPRV